MSIALTSVRIIDVLPTVKIILFAMGKKDEKSGMVDMSDLVTVTEAAKLRGVSRAAIHELVQRGRLRAERRFGRVLLYRSEIESFEKEKPGPKPSGVE